MLEVRGEGAGAQVPANRHGMGCGLEQDNSSATWPWEKGRTSGREGGRPNLFVVIQGNERSHGSGLTHR